ncbi:hypothetical protein TrRE_jg3943, partial [Triparma retinervis]
MGKKKGKKQSTAEDDEDWAILNDLTPKPPAAAEGADVGAADSAEAAAKDKATVSPPDAPDPDAGLTAEQKALKAAGLLDEDDGAPAEKKKKKKKKPAKKKGEGEGGSKAPLTAKGRMIAERLAKEKAEQERIDELNRMEEERVAEIERKEKEKEDEEKRKKEDKKAKQKAKVEAQKAAGTYMTKAQKQKAALAQERLAAMKKAGMIVGPDPSKAGGESGGPKKRVVYDNKKKGLEKKKREEEAARRKKEEEEEEARKAAEEAEAERLAKEAKQRELLGADGDVVDDWEDEADDWDAESNSDDDAKFDKLNDKLSSLTNDESPTFSDEEEEDTVGQEKKAEEERLRKLGLERKKRDEEERIKMEELSKLQEEANLKELMAEQLKIEGRKRREEREAANIAARSRDNLRCPIIVIMGHVDTGKTKLLDNIRRTNVQEGEAGGITQQIGATYFEPSTLLNRCKKLNETEKLDLTLPGILVIDTPGHESFTNLRSRGSNLCDLAILVVDLMHGLEQQTIESLKMLRSKGTPFVVALNKVDRCYNWKPCANDPIRAALSEQEPGTVQEFRSRAEEAKVQLAEQGVNSNIYWEMGEDDWQSSDFVPLVPTSAISGEGVQDILLLLCRMAQEKLWRQLMWCGNLQCTVLEVKAIEGLGMTVDVIVVNGTIKEGDKVVLCSMDGPVVSEIRGLLTPPPSREMRVKSEYIHHKEIKGALGVKLIGNGLEKVMAGTPVMVVGPDDEEEDIKAEVMSDLTSLTDSLSVDKKGVMVQASTLGALEALLQFLRVETKPPIPVSSVGIGTVFKKDVTKISIMKEKAGFEEYATILAFDVPVDKDARAAAEEAGVKIFTADIIYHLFDHFTRYVEEVSERRKQDASAVAVFPAIVKILPQHIFNQKDPIIVGMEVFDGILKVGTPLCVPALGGLHVGNVASIEMNGKEQQTARKGSSVAVKII